MKRWNQNGWGEKDMITYCGIIALVLFVIYASWIQFDHLLETSNVETAESSRQSQVAEGTQRSQDDLSFYHSLENQLEESSQKYMEDTYDDKEEDQLITSEQLLEKEYIEAMVDPEGDVCFGYVNYQSSDASYQAYVKCPLYTTDGYEEYE